MGLSAKCPEERRCKKVEERERRAHLREESGEGGRGEDADVVTCRCAALFPYSFVSFAADVSRRGTLPEIKSAREILRGAPCFSDCSLTSLTSSALTSLTSSAYMRVLVPLRVVKGPHDTLLNDAVVWLMDSEASSWCFSCSSFASPPASSSSPRILLEEDDTGDAEREEPEQHTQRHVKETIAKKR